jgi:peptide/nickel transport system ATP-binding protein
VFDNPAHPYTAALLASMPSMDPDRRVDRAPLTGDPPNPIDPPPGCRFHTRCAYAEPVCSRAAPGLGVHTQGHEVACYMSIPASGHSRAPAKAA